MKLFLLETSKLKNLYQVSDYRNYLRQRLGKSNERTGRKTQFANIIGCQASYLTQILNENANLSLEQAERANAYLEHNTKEAHLFLLLVQKERAGTKNLKAYFQRQIEQVKQENLEIKNRLGSAHELSTEQKSIYYSSWLFGFVHMALTIPSLQSVQEIAKASGLRPQKIKVALEQLEDMGIILKNGDTYQVTKMATRLHRESPEIIKHHSNLRQQAIESLEREEKDDLHYSAFVSLSQSDVQKIKEILLQSIQNALDVVRSSKSEKIFAVSVDFFDMDKS